MQGNKMIPCVVGMNKHGCAIRHPQKAGLTFGIVWGDNGGNMEGTLQEETTNAVRLFLVARPPPKYLQFDFIPSIIILFGKHNAIGFPEEL